MVFFFFFLLDPSQVHYILCKHYGTYVPRYICKAAILLKSCMQLKVYCSKALSAYSFSFTSNDS